MLPGQDNTIVTIIRKRENLNSLLHLPNKYLSIYRDMVSEAEPKWFDSILEKLNVKSFVARRKMSRLDNLLKMVHKKENEALHILEEMVNRAIKIREESASDNRLQIGDIVRLEVEQKIQKRVVVTIMDECSETVEFVQKRLRDKLPEEYHDWTEINFDPTSVASELPIKERVRLQEKWLRLIDEIQNEKTITSRLRGAESMRNFSFLSEQICNRLINDANRERAMMVARFKSLRVAIELGELSKIANFLNERTNGASLVDLESNFLKLAESFNDQGDLSA
ncbi:MAG: hypothetical protein D8M57_10875 [Candidatus Scalindua sp. AMX11]|nr:MAG: hypothetical protein DWQ00_16180 [Candidatus Scalindua sp.]NOG83736.1 hypothetical protein [Planctomycetota bacterium]RZV73816.1 MAG: hypothetical protein EX341_13220 [Candidatus Scalindua sp. SCAELEC01]TDE64821.1 MAG: hypothetical protein D8M57_10875 [Candidatus Scalindua sp. AMX11]GJQ60855.1 MAG: hypothetical protein SCALA701_36560 [Candidatus Scalindua sp.]